MTLSKELISAIRCIDEGNETQPLGFSGRIVKFLKNLLWTLTNLLKRYLFDKSVFVSLGDHWQKLRKDH